MLVVCSFLPPDSKHVEMTLTSSLIHLHSFQRLSLSRARALSLWNTLGSNDVTSFPFGAAKQVLVGGTSVSENGF